MEKTKNFNNFSFFLFPISLPAFHFFYMKKMKTTQRKLTFNEILANNEKNNSERLMSKARLANHLAKKSRGGQRKIAYYVKTNALHSLVKKMPERVSIRKDIILTDFVVVEMKNTNVGLHFPISNL